jgi:hypothetical protein
MKTYTNYDEWLAEVKRQWDSYVKGVPFDDLPDWSHHFREWFASNMRPSAAFARLIDSFTN